MKRTTTEVTGVARAALVAVGLLALSGAATGTRLTASAAGGTIYNGAVEVTWLTPDAFRPTGDPRQCALVNDGSYLYRSVGTCTTYVARVPMQNGNVIVGYSLIGVDNDPAAQMSIGFVSPAIESRDLSTDFFPEVNGYAMSAAAHSGVSTATPAVQAISATAVVTMSNGYSSVGPGMGERYEAMWYTDIAITVPSSEQLRVFGVQLHWRTQYAAWSATNPTFTDVPASHPYYSEISRLEALGITKGCGNDRYCPDAPVTRGQMAVFLARLLGPYDERAND